MQKVLSGLVLLLAIQCFHCNPSGPPASLLSNGPDIIFILIDDQRHDFLSFRGHPWIETPNIDRLAENSLYFDHAYVTTSLCSPSRASIVTGQYAHAHRVLDNDTPIPGGIPTFPQELQKGGYHTGFVGKWHMGGSNDMPRPGFDYWASFKGQGAYTNPEMNIDGERIPFNGYTPDILTELSREFIEARAENDQPYFLFLSHKSVHEPFTPAPRHEGYYAHVDIPRPDEAENFDGKPQWLKDQRESWHGADRDWGLGHTSVNHYGDFDGFFQRYSECMLAVDESVGKIHETLERLGRLENTVIIYYSDNGYMMGEHGLIDKRVMYEESIRVPAFVHWPAEINQPSISSDFILNVDLGPTMLDLAGLPVPSSMHGRSFVPLMEGDNANWRNAFVYEYFVDPKAVQTPTIFGLRTKAFSYMTYHGVWDQYELYDMAEDPQQYNNLLGDIQYGHAYGTFVEQIARQDPVLYEVVEPLDSLLTAHMVQIGGSQQPIWVSEGPDSR